MLQPFQTMSKNCCEGGGGGGGSHVACLNFNTSRAGVYKYFTSLLEIKRKFFVFVGILENGG